MNQQHLAIGQDVIFVNAEKKQIKGRITKVYGPHSAQIEWGNGVAVANFSSRNEPGTFHFEQASPKAESQK